MNPANAPWRTALRQVCPSLGFPARPVTTDFYKHYCFAMASVGLFTTKKLKMLNNNSLASISTLEPCKNITDMYIFLLISLPVLRARLYSDLVWALAANHFKVRMQDALRITSFIVTCAFQTKKYLLRFHN